MVLLSGCSSIAMVRSRGSAWRLRGVGGVGSGAAWQAASVLVSLARKEKRAHASWCRRVTDVVHLARVLCELALAI